MTHRLQGRRWLEDLAADVRYAVRQLGRSRLVALTAVTTLALGIGANTAMFTAIETVLLRPLPFRDPARLVLVSEYRPGNVSKTGAPLGRYRERAEAGIFEQTGAYWDVSGGNGIVFDSRDAADRLRFSVVTGDFFSMLGVRPSLGRAFTASENAAGGAKVFMASAALWQRLLGGHSGAIGQSFRLDGEPYTLVGVLPPEFDFPVGCDVWLPAGTLSASSFTDRVSHQFWMVGRLRPAATLVQAQAELDAVQARASRTYPASDENWRVRVTPLLDEFVGDVRAPLWLLFAAVAFVLLIACTNVVNLLLARAVLREKEFAVRAALGAGRGRLVRQALAETLLIVVASTILALVVARLGLKTIIALSSASLPRFEQPQLSGAVLGFSAALALLITGIVGLVPGLHASTFAPADALQTGSRGGTVNPRRRNLRNLLIAFEVALTVVLLTAAGLTLRSFQQLRRVDPGFRPERLVSMKIALPDALYPRTEQRSAFLQAVLERLTAAPGVLTVAAADRLPLSGERNWGSFNVVGRPALGPAQASVVETRAVTANYFRTVGVPLLRGRDFTAGDLVQDQPVVVINQVMAERFWPGDDPVGAALLSPYHPADPPRRIIGVVGNVKDFALDAASPPELYGTVRWWNEINLILRSQLDLATLTVAVRHEIAAIDRNVPVYDATMMQDLVMRSMGRQRFELVLLALFAAMALVLAAIGIYGVLAFVVSSRTQEIGIRLALGATPARTVLFVLGEGMTWVVAGLAAGLATALLVVRVIRSLLFQVSPTDPLTLVGVALALALVGMLACLVPARRAMRVDPLVALRAE